MNYYNEFDPFAAAWLRELMKDGLIPEGEVDERSIADVHPLDLVGFRQCHFFAGIGGWSYALRLAGWPDDRPVWTGSCPCQPFSAAGKGLGERDPRHLWPEFRRLIEVCRPAVVFGEQVASRAGRDWLARVRADLEGMAYAAGAADLCAAGVGAPHIRQRLFWVADAVCGRAGYAPGQGVGTQATIDGQDGHLSGQRLRAGIEGATSGRLADASDPQRWPVGRSEQDGCDGPDGGWQEAHGESRTCGEVRGMGDADSKRESAVGRISKGPRAESARGSQFWSSAIFIPCADGKARRIEPGIFPLADGFPNRVGILRGAGNAIVPQLAAEFARAFRDPCVIRPFSEYPQKVI